MDGGARFQEEREGLVKVKDDGLNGNEPLNFKHLLFPGVKGDKGDQGRPGKDGKQGERGEKGRISMADMMMLNVTKMYLINIPLYLLQNQLFP